MVRVDHGLNRRSRFLTRPRVGVAGGCVAGIMAGLAICSASPNAYPRYPGTGPTSRAAGGLDELHSDGSAILDRQGRQVVLRGMNVTGMLQARDIDPGAPPTTDDFARMHAFGFDVIRLAISWSRLEPQHGTSLRPTSRRSSRWWTLRPASGSTRSWTRMTSTGATRWAETAHRPGPRLSASPAPDRDRRPRTATGAGGGGQLRNRLGECEVA